MTNGESTTRVILGLDVSTACVGISIVKETGDGVPEIIALTHKSPKVSSKIKGIEALFIRKNIFEEEFLKNISEYVTEPITDVVIEEPLLSSNNTNTVATLLRYNGMISEAVYRILGVVPNFISSYDARMYSFPDLISLRKYNKKGEEYSLKHIEDAIKNNKIVLFGGYPFDIYKKMVMKNMVDNLYPGIEWALNAKGELKKENFDACDALICVLAFININRYGIEEAKIIKSSKEETDQTYIFNYSTKIWDKVYEKTLFLTK